jgi:hypothetical protein
MSRVAIAGGTFVVMSSGEAEGPSQPLVRYQHRRFAVHVSFDDRTPGSHL